jgi:hypothetical protein
MSREGRLFRLRQDRPRRPPPERQDPGSTARNAADIILTVFELLLTNT